MDGRGEGGAEPPRSPEPTPAPPAAPIASAGPAALQEDQISNAVAFLGHPKVRASSAASKREFLQRKGLTEAEIDEAFRRVPEAPASPPPVAAPSAVQSTLHHLQPPPQQPGAYGHAQSPAGAVVPQQQAAPQQPPEAGVRWTQVALGAGFVGASAYAAKALVWPYLEDAWRSWHGTTRPPPRPRDVNGGEGGELSPEATRAVAEAIQAQTAELRSSVESIKALAGGLGAARAPGDGGALTADALRQELRSFAASLHDAASPADAAAAAASSRLEGELGEIKSLLAEILRSPSGSRSPGKEAGGGGGTPLSVTSALPAAQRGGFVTPRAEGDGAGVEAAPTAGGGGGGEAGGGGGAGGGAEAPPHPASYLEVLEMLERGQTPPGIRTDINDKPPNPLAAPAEPKLKPRPKPWEQRGAGANPAAAAGSSGSPPALGVASAAAPHPEPAGVPAASPATPRLGAAEEGSGSGGGPSPVRAVSPAAGEAQGGEGEGREPPQRSSSFKSPRPAAASIFAAGVWRAGPPRRAAAALRGAAQRGRGRPAAPYRPLPLPHPTPAVAPAPDSPHVIAGRLTPAAAAGRTAGGVASPAGAAAQAQAAPGASSSFSALLAAAQERAGPGTGPPLPGGAPGDPVLEGSGLGRPSSRNWRPPPIPVSSLGSAGASGASTPAAPPEGAGAGARVPSSASLGEDFASA